MLEVLKVFVLIFALVFLATLSSSIIIDRFKRRKKDKSISSEEQSEFNIKGDSE